MKLVKKYFRTKIILWKVVAYWTYCLYVGFSFLSVYKGSEFFYSKQ